MLGLSYLSGQNNYIYWNITTTCCYQWFCCFVYATKFRFHKSIDYATLALTHANQSYHVYSKTANPRISLSGKFGNSRNKTDGEYALAAIHFLRTNSKMYFGENDRMPVFTPPVMSLDGLRTYV